MMTWPVVILLAAGVLGQRLFGAGLGATVLQRRPLFQRLGDALPPAVLAAVIAQLSLTTKGDIAIDARIPGLAVAALFAWRRQPLVVVVAAAAATTASVRLLGG